MAVLTAFAAPKELLLSMSHDPSSFNKSPCTRAVELHSFDFLPLDDPVELIFGMNESLDIKVFF
jgi:hypothetical protein